MVVEISVSILDPHYDQRVTVVKLGSNTNNYKMAVRLFHYGVVESYYSPMNFSNLDPDTE